MGAPEPFATTPALQKGAVPAGSVIASSAPPPARRIAVLVLAGSAIVGATAGALLLISAESQYATVRQLAAQTERSCPAGDPRPTGLCAELMSAAADTDRMGNLGIGTLVLGGLLGAGAGVLALVPAGDSPPPPKRNARLIPFASVEAGGVVFQGSF